jgi:hypothetical protein
MSPAGGPSFFGFRRIVIKSERGASGVWEMDGPVGRGWATGKKPCVGCCNGWDYETYKIYMIGARTSLGQLLHGVTLHYTNGLADG